jgi:hypothetical protein
MTEERQEPADRTDADHPATDPAPVESPGAGGTVAPEVHRQIAVDAFNRAWSLMDLPQRAPEQDDELIHLAHASRHHWGIVGTPVHRARGEWQVSRVYALLGRAEPARFHAQRCLDLCEANDIAGFDLAFAHEAMARAAAVHGDEALMTEHLGAAARLAAQIEDDDDRAVVEADLATVPAAFVPRT